MEDESRSGNCYGGVSGVRLAAVEALDKSALFNFTQNIAANETIVVRRPGTGIFVFDLIEDRLYFFRRGCWDQPKVTLREELIRFIQNRRLFNFRIFFQNTDGS